MPKSTPIGVNDPRRQLVVTEGPTAEAIEGGAEPCSLCGLPIAQSFVHECDRHSRRAYCCPGCAAVDDILSTLPEEERATAAVEIAQRLGLPRPQLEALGGELQEAEEVDEPPSGSAITEHRFRVDGLHCPSCAWLSEHMLSAQPGVVDAQVDFLTEIGSVRLDLRQTSRERALSVLRQVGYNPRSLEDETDADPERILLRCALAAIAAMNTMMLAFAHYAEVLGASAGEWKTMIGGLGAAISLPAVVYCGTPIYRRALGSARLGRLSMESLLALGIAASVTLSLLAFVLPGADFYFEIPTMIVMTALASRLADRFIRRSGARQVANLLKPRAVRVRLASEPGSPAGFVQIDEVRVGDRIVVPAGEEVPADVELRGESVTVSEAVLSGEPTPILKLPESTVLAGSVIIEGDLGGEVLRRPAESAHALIGQQILAVLRGQQERAAAADRVAAVFVVLILIVAAFTIIGHALLTGVGFDSPAAWLPAIAVLVVACPCAFSIAASASMGAAALRLLREGVLLRDPEALDRAAVVDTVVFDKTGTLTVGDMEVRELEWRAEAEPEVSSIVAALERGSRHPMAAAIRRFLAAEELSETHVEQVEELPGRGVIGVFGEDSYAIGSSSLFDEPDLFHSDEAAPRPYVLFGRNGKVLGRFVFHDRLRDTAAAAVSELQRLGIEVLLLSGDDEVVVKHIAGELGIERFEGRALPASKAERVRALREEGRHVAYVGDGVNDAPALAAASVGMAMRHGASMALETAGLLAIRDDPMAAGRTLLLARRLSSITKQNYVWALGWNLLLVPVAVVGLLHPAWAALAMLLSSVTVLANSARLLWGSKEP